MKYYRDINNNKLFLANDEHGNECNILYIDGVPRLPEHGWFGEFLTSPEVIKDTDYLIEVPEEEAFLEML